jgi:3-hydroxyacyl-CoA dehydrogenase
MTEDTTVTADIGSRVFGECFRQACFLLEEGCVPRQIDTALQQWGWAMGPFRAMDLGADLGQPDRLISQLPDMVRAKGRRGQQNGAGWYLYMPQARNGLRDPEIEAMVVAHSVTIGVPRREIFLEEIVERCHLVMVNEAARLLDEGIACRPSDIDDFCVAGYGFPASKGGPMYQADLAGLSNVLERLRFFQGGYQGWAFEPAKLLIDLAATSANFASLNSGRPR